MWTDASARTSSPRGHQAGTSYKQAAALAEVSYASLNRWRQQGSQPDAPAEFRNFCNQIEAAEAQAADKLLKIILSAAAERDWKAAAWLLERRHPEDWGKKEAAIEPRNSRRRICWKS
jgi:hypothetical protein